MPVQFEVKTSVINWFSLFVAHRAVVVRNDEIVQGLLHPDFGADHALLREALGAWKGTHFLHQTPHGTQLTLVRPLGPRPPERWWLHLLLGLLTLLATTVSGAYIGGHAPLVEVPVGPLGIPVPVRLDPSELLPGLLFSVPLMAILLVHELGHYLVARRHRMDVSPPYFIPSPSWLNFIGTFGAFIRLRSVVVNRAVLLDVGAGGPLAGFVLSLPVLLAGLARSVVVPVAATPPLAPFVVDLHGPAPLWLGDSLLMHGLAALFGLRGGAVLLHPLAFAGWIGLFVTALNLLPLSQLDGGHILYALLGRGQRWAGLAFVAALLLLGRYWWGWWLWAGVILLLGRGRIRHPSVFDPAYPVEGRRRWVGWACVALFVLTFCPIPLQL